MENVPSNFAFLAKQTPGLAQLGALAERYFVDDAPGSLVKLRQLAEFIAKDVAARQAVLPSADISFDDALRAIRTRSALPRNIGDMFFHLKRVGNRAVHENVGTPGEALAALKIARTIAVWFHQSYQGAVGFKPGPFVPPATPADASKALQDEVAALRDAVRASADSEAKARLQAQEAEATRLAALAESDALLEAKETERRFWEAYAAEAESEGARKAAAAALATTQATARTTPPVQLDALAQLAASQATKVELDEATTGS